MPLNRLPNVIKKTSHQRAEETKEEHWRDFEMCETGTGHQVAQLHVS
jgi:hypothetical protein